MSGKEEFDKAGEKLKVEQVEKEEKALEAKQQAISQLDSLHNNKQLAKMYNDNASLGAENLAGELPLLKIHAVGKSTKNELSNGEEPNDGWFFYKPTGEQWKEIECHILTISKGFKAEGLEGKETFNQIMGGVIIDNGEYKPFVMYFTGLKLSFLWEFGKEASRYTKAKPVSIPLFALTVRLTTQKKANNYGKSWVASFEIVKNLDGSPVLILDEGIFQYLKDNVSGIQSTINSIIDLKTVGADPTPSQPEEIIDGEIQRNDPVHASRNTAEDIPF